MNLVLQLLIALPVVSSALSSATYYIIDDTNTTIHYSGATTWFPASNSTFYNGTATWNICATSNNCQMKIPFTGSGITLYMVQWSASNFSVSIDGSTPVLRSFSEGDPFGKLNVTAYDQQSLQSGSHNLDFMLLDTTDIQGSYLRTGASDFAFDYAVVNETNAFPTPPLHTSTSGRSSVMAPAVGGALGGIAVVIAGISIFCWLRKGNRHQSRPEEYVQSPFDQQASRLHSNTGHVPGLKNTVHPADTPPAASPPPSRNTPVISIQPPQLPTSLAPSSNLATALDAVSRLRPTAGQRQVLMGSLNPAAVLSSSSSALPSTRANGPSRTQPVVSEASDRDAVQQSESLELMAALDSFSRLTQAERRTLVSVLGTLMASSGDLTGQDSVFSSPPPYND